MRTEATRRGGWATAAASRWAACSTTSASRTAMDKMDVHLDTFGDSRERLAEV